MSVNVFCSYSHRDDGLRQQIVAHLSPLRREGRISIWHDREITPGSDWAREIDNHLEQADVILLLVSADFISSDYCWGQELTRALELHKLGRASVVPIILRATDWASAPFRHLQALPKDARPVTSWENQDEALTDVARGIRRVIDSRGATQITVGAGLLDPREGVDFPTNSERASVLPEPLEDTVLDLGQRLTALTAAERARAERQARWEAAARELLAGLSDAIHDVRQILHESAGGFRTERLSNRPPVLATANFLDSAHAESIWEGFECRDAIVLVGGVAVHLYVGASVELSSDGTVRILAGYWVGMTIGRHPSLHGTKAIWTFDDRVSLAAPEPEQAIARVKAEMLKYFPAALSEFVGRVEGGTG